jgi:hypothetical protein
MSKINFEIEINSIISQQQIFEEKLYVIIRDFKKLLVRGVKVMNENNLKLEKKQKKNFKFVYNKH